MNRTQRDGLILVLISAAGFSFFAIFTKLVYDNSLFNPLDILIWRFLISTPITWGIRTWMGRKQSSQNPASVPRGRLIALGILFALVALVAFFAIERVPVSLYTVLIYTYPALVALGAIFFGESLSGRGWIALGLTLIGVVLTVPNIFQGFQGVDPIGVLLVLMNAASYALYILLSSRVLRTVKDLPTASTWSISGSFVLAVGLIMFRVIQGGHTTLPSNNTVWFGLVGLAVISTVIPIFTFHAGMHKLGASRAAIVSMVEPVMTLVWAVIIRHESLQPIQLVGSAFILLSVVLLQIRHESPPIDIAIEEMPPVTG